MEFKKDFFWGGATAANQTEGAWNIGGRGPILSDVTTAGSVNKGRMITYIDKDGKPGYLSRLQKLPEGAHYAVLDDCYYPNHEAIDFYHRYKEDIALMKELGFKMCRFSIAWSRIYPTGLEDEPNKEGIEFYRKVFEELRKNDIEPLVTIWHFDTPLYLEEKLGGWKNRELIKLFAKYATTCFKEFKGLVKYWLTFNEINNTINFLPENCDDKLFEEAYQILHNQFVASAKAVKIGHSIDKDNIVGCMICGITYYPHTDDPKDILFNRYKWEKGIFYCGDVQCFGEYPVFAEKLWREHNVKLNITEEDIKDLKEGTVDIYTFSYYVSQSVTTHINNEQVKGNMSTGTKNSYLNYSEWGWSCDPDGLNYFLQVVNDRYKRPIMITENGLGAKDTLEEDGKVHDYYRIDYLKKHINAMKDAIDNGVNLIGYMPWGWIDLVSASTGEMAKRYGMVYVKKYDDGTGDLSRIKKDSFYWYKKVIASNGEDLD